MVLTIALLACGSGDADSGADLDAALDEASLLEPGDAASDARWSPGTAADGSEP